MSYFNDNEDYIVHNSRPVRLPRKNFFIIDYKDVKHEVQPCPKCGKAPARNNCGPEYQGIACFDCNIYASYDKEGKSNDMLLEALSNWNAGRVTYTDLAGEVHISLTQSCLELRDSKGQDYVIALGAVSPCTCGSTSLLLRETLTSKRYILCHNCKRETMSYLTWDEAVKEWNGEKA